MSALPRSELNANKETTQEEIEEKRRLIRLNDATLEKGRKFETSEWFILVILGLCIGIFFVAHFPKYVSEHLLSYEKFYKQQLKSGESGSIGEVGDLIGGTMGPPIAITGAVLTFLAFWVQFRANQIQRLQYNTSVRDQNWAIEDQQRNWQKEQIESRFFELLKLHKENVNEMNIEGKIQGRKCFVAMYQELRWLYNVVELEYKKSKASDPMFENIEIDTLEFSYNIFFNGYRLVGPSGSMSASTKLHLSLAARIEELRCKWRTRNVNNNAEAVEEAKKGKVNLILREHDIVTFDMARPGESRDDLRITVYYLPFEGHADALGHYYRHLLQTCKYVVKQDILSQEDKIEYIRMLRAQLSNFEQLMLYYNAIAWFEGKWKDLFINYRLIKNIPLDLANFYSLPQVRYLPEMKQLLMKNIKLFENQQDPI
ncbi:putative phage abortive infection protein [Chitinophaga ginsengisegetis]|uniref:putative phage abortive infection protein n=1 Tax=Chitinophaga ginsengisegetis TaxID=393003 RepID=UPI000DB9A6CD|nr:putative phage abortive infection protein [Chitinophaga ginsengisegetis]MDR6570733.1 hypothetical protein [Chitinophaga ginsengisegetis]MDR6650467.1 hypothetical protein [Chitinophaga ginsengisegetis]MDR6656894.1 hypothetical protein [Chitinophaga ginsengisegetis]